MHRCSNHISCLSVSCKRIGKDLDVIAWRIGLIPDVRCHQINKGLQVTCSLVCTVNRDAYLMVEPDYVWLTPDMIGREFDIISNVNWNIV